MATDTIYLLLEAAGLLVSFGIFYGAIKEEIKQLRREVEKHNGVIERQYALEGRVDTIENEIRIYHKD